MYFRWTRLAEREPQDGHPSREESKSLLAEEIKYLVFAFMV
jgi:hypothetical protein